MKPNHGLETHEFIGGWQNHYKGPRAARGRLCTSKFCGCSKAVNMQGSTSGYQQIVHFSKQIAKSQLTENNN